MTGLTPEGEAMSTADDAERDGVLTNGTREPYERGYADGRRAGYRRALEDAADAAEGAGLQPAGPWLRRRAASVGTKDGDDDE